MLDSRLDVRFTLVDAIGCLWDFVFDRDTRITGDSGITQDVVHVQQLLPRLSG